MFNDKIILHKNVDNPFNVKITDRSRRTFVPDNENTMSILFRVLDNKSVVVVKQYLTLIREGKFYTSIIPREIVNKLSSEINYKFMTTLVNSDIVDSSGCPREQPLYTDHTFECTGYLKVHDNFKDMYTERFDRTEKYVFIPGNDVYNNPIYNGATDKKFEGKHVFSEVILNDGYLYDIEVISKNKVDTCNVTFQVNNQSHWPLSPRGEQWDDSTISLKVGVDKTSVFQKIPERVYSRIVIHTLDPSNFYMLVTKIQK